MLVPTVKAPNGRRKCRIVICGNRIEKAHDGSGHGVEEKPNDFTTYAGGADGTLLRCLVRKSAAESWTIGTMDVATAFLLAPRRAAAQDLLIMKPPRILVEAEVCKETDLWSVENAVYGLQTSPADWSSYRNSVLGRMRWWSEGKQYQLMSTPQQNLWKILPVEEPVEDRDDPKGYLALYVDDIMATGEGPLVRALLSRVREEWRCSEPEFVEDGGSAVKFCGFELTRPDLAYGVSWMGRMVTKAPRRVRQYGEHMVGYVKSTLEMSLAYGKCPGPEEDGALAFPRSMRRLEIHSDASFAPAGGKGHQGLIAMYGGVPAQWESKQQSFGTLSTAESELLGYTDGLTLGESVAAVVELLEPAGITDKVLYGDNEAGLRLIQSPDGPWRTRHLRLRAFVLKERVALEIWRARHVPGAQLTADHLTKAVVSAASWQRFRRWMSLILPEEVKAGDQGNGAENAGSFSKITGMMVAAPSISKIAKVAGAVGFAALAAWMTQHKGPEGHKNAAKEDPIRARHKTIGPSRAADPRVGAPEWWAVERRCSREDEPGPVGKDVRENEPTSSMGARDHEPATIYSSPWGSLDHPRLCAVRAGQTFGPRPCLGSLRIVVRMICGCKYLVGGWYEFIGSIAAAFSTPSTEAALSKLSIWKIDASPFRLEHGPPVWSFNWGDPEGISISFGEGISCNGIDQYQQVWIRCFYEWGFGWKLVSGGLGHGFGAEGCGLEAIIKPAAMGT
eukprot:s2459_g22.t1